MARTITFPGRWRLGFIFLCISCCTRVESIDHLLDSSLPPIPEGIKVGAYYYPWHADDFHRDDGYLRDLLDPRHQPTLGEYDDTRPEIVAQHLAWSRQANIRLWVCSWWGAGAREDITISNVILKHTDLGDHQIALLYESTGRIKSKENWDPKRVGPDIKHMCENYFDHPNYYKVDGKPVILMYLARVLSEMDVLGGVVDIMRETARLHCNKELFIIGDQVWSGAPKQNEEYPAFDALDAVTNYDLYGNMNNPPYAGQAVVDDYYKEQKDWKQRAGESNVRYIPAVSPGYNDRGVRFEKGNIGLSRRLTRDSEPGTLFVAQLQQARYLVDPGVDNLLLVNSFNEWHEDSQIEPAVGEPTTLPLEFTNGIEYEGYGELYLNILRATTCDSSCPPIDEWKSIALQKDPFDGPPPSNVLVGAYYYAWYGPDFHNNKGYLRSQLDARQGPVLGEYDDTDPFVIAEHLRMSRQANIGLWIASWWGPDADIDSTIRNVILPHKDLGDFQISLLYAVGSRVSEANGWDLEIVAADMEYICTSYFDQPNYFRSFGRPVIFLPVTRALYSKGVLESILEMMRSIASHHGYDDIFIVGDQVWDKAPVEEIYIPFFLLDAVTNIDIYGNMGSHGYAGLPAIDKYYQRQRDWRNKAWSSKCGFVPAVTPGFNDRGFKFSANHHALSRKLTEESEPGSFFAASLAKARYLVDSELNNLLIVNSFNQWHEDTQIEPVLGNPTSSPLNVTENITYYGYGELYLDILRNATQDVGSIRLENHPQDDFYPLRCNVVSSLSTLPCEIKWTTLFGTDVQHEGEIVIPCATCVVLDHPGPLLKLLGGIDIQGKLLIPDGYRLGIEASYIRVQGELQIMSTKPIDGSPDVVIALAEGEPGIEKFTPATSNGYACGVQRCDPGPKSIIVAGGKLDIHGIPPETPTWVQLVDVVTESPPPDFWKPEYCPAEGKNIFSETFDDPSNSLLSATIGANVVFEQSVARVLERSSTHHGVQLEMRSFIGCLRPDETYTLFIKVRLYKEGMEETDTKCAELGTNCLHVISDYMTPEQTLKSIPKYDGPVRAKFKYGQWMTIETDIAFRVDELDPSNVYSTLRIAGGEKGVDLEIQEISLKNSAQMACSRSPPDCRDLVACNGDAELGISMSPFNEKDGADIRIAVEDGNLFYRVEREESTSALAGMEWNVPLDCMRENTVYRFEMKVRNFPHDGNPIATTVYIRSHRDGGDTQQRVTICPESSGDWVLCNAYFTFENSLFGDLTDASMYFETVGSTTSTYDVDNLSFKFVHMEGLVTGLVVSDTVKEKWAEGSEILITSHSLNWDDQHVRKIVGIQDYMQDDGLVVLELDRAIARPPTKQNSDFPVEVALLSRNILFEGLPNDDDFSAGGHLTVYHTPDVEQVIEGAEFRNFGQHGVLDRYPILFHYSKSAAGSRIARNTIRDSYQGCIVLAGTNDVLVEENIAFDTAGHCFVLKDGMETGNTLRRNLGAKTRLPKASVEPNNLLSDDGPALPCTFLVANPLNVIEGNIGAGSEGEAFAIILKDNVEGPHAEDFNTTKPASLPLNDFRQNFAHSNHVRGFHLQMTSEYRADSASILLDSMYAYRNSGPAILLINSQNVFIDNSHFADNRGNIDVHRSENVLINNTSIIGMSQELRRLESAQRGLPSVLCPDRRTYVTGIEMHAFTRSRQGNGVSLENVVMSDFTDIKKCKEYAFKVDPELGWGPFDFFSQISNLRIEGESVPRFHLCEAVRSNVRDIYVTDQDSSLRPPGSDASGVSSIVSQSSSVLQFIPEEKQTYVSGFCYNYCQDTCLRTVVFSIDPVDERELELHICERGNLEKCVSYSGTIYFEPFGAAAQSFVLKGKYYYVTLPKGRYEANFADADGNRVWPTFVETTYLEALCDDALVEGSIWLPIPRKSAVEEQSCVKLLQNGDAEHDGVHHSFWIGGPAGLDVRPDVGMGNTQAFCDISPTLGFDSASAYSIGQYIDTRCLLEYRTYNIEAWVSLVDKTTNEAVAMKCPDAISCPKVGFYFVSNDGLFSWFEEVNLQSNIFDAQSNRRRRRRAQPAGAIPYEAVEAKLLVDAEMASASSVFFYIDRNNQDENVVLCVDNLSVTLNS